jgi:predicted aspartyl protease
MKKFLFLSILLVSVLTSCKVIRTVSLMKRGSVQQKEFTTTVPFEIRRGLIVLKVGIAGEVYDFILDTGAPNVVSTELAEKLGLRSKVERKVGDSQSKKNDLGFAEIENIEIGGINFLNTGAAIADLKMSDAIRCLDIDGLIGSNLMRKAIWKFDFQAQVITITTSMDAIELGSDVLKIPFTTSMQGTPIMNVKLDSTTHQTAIIDLGSNGGFSFNKKSGLSIAENDKSIEHVEYYGAQMSGLYGLGAPDTIMFAKVPNIVIGDVQVSQTIATFSKTNAIIGTEFFSNYDLIINWNIKEALLIKRKDFINSSLEEFGFNIKYEEKKVLIGGLYSGSSAHKEGLLLNDQITQIGDRMFDNVSPEEWCEIMFADLHKEDDQEVVVKVLRDGAVVTFTLKREKIL